MIIRDCIETIETICIVICWLSGKLAITIPGNVCVQFLVIYIDMNLRNISCVRLNIDFGNIKRNGTDTGFLTVFSR